MITYEEYAARHGNNRVSPDDYDGPKGYAQALAVMERNDEDYRPMYEALAAVIDEPCRLPELKAMTCDEFRAQQLAKFPGNHWGHYCPPCQARHELGE